VPALVVSKLANESERGRAEVPFDGAAPERKNLRTGDWWPQPCLPDISTPGGSHPASATPPSGVGLRNQCREGTVTLLV
jgi:hypothetical protein